MEEYIDARLYIIIPVLYAVGAALKKSRVSDWLIPFIIGVAGIVLATAYIFATDAPQGAFEVLTALFSGICQGMLCASASVYANNLVKQAAKRLTDGGDRK